MKQAIRINIPEPCHEGWDKMTPKEQGRFCMSCQKVVVDFSAMSDQQILDHISNASGNTCGRVYTDQLNRVMVPEKKRYSFKYFWSLLITSSLISYRASAQGQIKTTSLTCSKPDTLAPSTKAPVTLKIGKIAASREESNIEYVINGKILDAEGQPIHAATVMIKNTRFGTLTDKDGKFRWKGKVDVVNTILEISAVGYKTRDVTISPAMIENIYVEKQTVDMLIKPVTVEMQPAVAGEVVITRVRKPDTGIVKKIGLFDKAKAFFSGGSNDIKIFPNPLPANGNFSLWLNIKETGDYTVEFIDASGQVVLMKQIEIAYRGQLLTFNSRDLKGSGTYFVRVKGKQNKGLYHSKLVVQ